VITALTPQIIDNQKAGLFLKPQFKISEKIIFDCQDEKQNTGFNFNKHHISSFV
jgi:hypothetical protein